MPSCCPTCGHPIAAGDADARDALTLMRAAALMAGIKTTWDDYVTERDAARLLNRARSTLRNRRGMDCPIPFRKRAGRIEYALSDLAEFRE